MQRGRQRGNDGPTGTPRQAAVGVAREAIAGGGIDAGVVLGIEHALQLVGQILEALVQGEVLGTAAVRSRAQAAVLLEIRVVELALRANDKQEDREKY